MPLRASVVAAPPPPPPPGQTTERLFVTWTAPDGTVMPLTNRALGWWLIPGAMYLGAAPVTVVTDPNPRGGITVRHVQPEARIIALTHHVQGSTHVEFMSRWRQVARAYTQTRRLGLPGTLTVVQPDGVSRQIEAWYQAGMDGQPGLGWLQDQPVITLLCPDPYWTDVTDTAVVRTYSGGDSESFLAPFPHITDSRVLGATTISVDGDAEVWPVWTITGPASGITATRSDTGDEFTLTPIGGAMIAGDVVTITTDPPSVIGPDGSSWIAALDWPDAVLWGLPPGDTPVVFTVSGADANTSITLAYRNRWETV